MADNNSMLETAGTKPPMARRAHFFIQAAGLVFVLSLWLRSFKNAGISGDLWLVLLILPPWLLSSYLIRKGMSVFRWTENLGRMLGCSVDSYFLVSAMGLASHDSAIVIRAFFVFLFVVALAGGPVTILMALITGVSAYFAVLYGDASALSLKIMMMAGFLGGLCGMAWKLVTPLLWKAVQLLIAEPKPVEREKSADELELEALAAAGFGRPATAAQEATPLPFVQPESASENGAENGENGKENAEKEASAQQAYPMADVEALRLALRDKESALLALNAEKEGLGAELEMLKGKLNGASAPADERVSALEKELVLAKASQQAAEATAEKLRVDLAAAEQEMAKLYGMDAPPPDSPPAPAKSEQEVETAELRKKLGEALAEKDKLAAELEKTNDELMKVYGNT